VQKVVRARDIANEKRPDLDIDGEFQLDTALIPETAAKKMKRGSKVAGKANVIVFPDLNAGNIGVKLIQIFGKALAHGPMLQGFQKPVSDFSRGAPVEEIVGNLIILANRAGK
jgi:phosphate acetyltransferase